MPDDRELDEIKQRRRQAVLDSTIATYDDYVETGYAERWANPRGGMLIAIGDRDRWLVDALVPSLSGTIVDLGCGDGALGVLLQDAGRRPAALVGVDLLERRLAEARERVPWGSFVAASADDLPMSDGSASAVVAMTLFSSLTNDWLRERVAGEIRRVLHPGGRLVVYDIRYPSPSNRHVRPVTPKLMRALFPGWSVHSRTMTLLPPLSRSPVARGSVRYRLLHALPVLRSHVGMVVLSPATDRTG